MKRNEEIQEAIKYTITKYKEIIFGPDTPVRMAHLDELQKQQFIDKKVYDQRLMDEMVRKLTWDGIKKKL